MRRVLLWLGSPTTGGDAKLVCHSDPINQRPCLRLSRSILLRWFVGGIILFRGISRRELAWHHSRGVSEPAYDDVPQQLVLCLRHFHHQEEAGRSHSITF